MQNTNTTDHTLYQGAWLTDVDDTLLPSGHSPDDEWIDRLTFFIETLKRHNILWAPVSGVDFSKMGPRVLKRLPQHVLSHVFYYGGEGSTRHHYDFESGKWQPGEAFKRHFNDAQAVALIGEKRLSQALKLQGHKSSAIHKRLEDAKIILSTQAFHDTSLVDEMQSLLINNNYRDDLAETYYRGGAISWLMLGDQSVEKYRGERESKLRTLIRDYAEAWLEQHNNLKQLGNNPVHMPYKHATRGIKIVLEGNDKGRAAEDLSQSFGIASEAILFFGNELYEGGNDNTIRRVPGVHALSVGETEDPGVINAGVQVEANQLWMEWIAQDQLSSGKSWQTVLGSLEEQAPVIRLATRIIKEQRRSSDMSQRHAAFSANIKPNFLAEIIIDHRSLIEDTRNARVAMRKLEYDLLARLAVLKEYHYDEARKLVRNLTDSNKAELGQSGTGRMASKMKQLLLSELKQIIVTTYVDQLNLAERTIHNYIDKVNTVDDMAGALHQLFIDKAERDYPTEKTRADNLINNWCSRIERLTEDWFDYMANWKQKKAKEQSILAAEPRLDLLRESFSDYDIYYYFKRIIPRLYNFPHLKDLDKPTIVLVAGTSGVGKSSVSQHISNTLGITTCFSTDVTSRSVMRATYKNLLGTKAKETYPELYGSSFDGDSLDWFYAQSLLSMVGTSGSIERLQKENVSAVIDGVSLVPGSLAEEFFETANIVWLVVCVSDKETHYERMGTRSETGVDRGGTERYRQKFSTIRNNHDRLVTMGKRANAYIADNNGSLGKTLEEILHHIKTPFSDRGLPIVDSFKDRAQKTLAIRTYNTYKNY